MKKLVALLLILTQYAFASGVPFVAPNDTLQLGKSAAGDKTIIFNTGSGSANPKIKLDSSTGKLKFSNDGSNFSAFGTGSGGSGLNLLADNPDFENGTVNWTASGGTFTIATSGSNLLVGTGSGVFTPSASVQTLTSTQYTIPNGLLGRSCLAKVLYQTAETTNQYILNVIDGSSVILASSVLTGGALPSTGTVAFRCPTSGTIALQILTAGTVPTNSIALDSAHLGENILLGQISQAKDYGSLVYTATSGCNWTVASATYGTDFAANASCPAPTVTGSVAAPSTKVPQFVINSAAPGTYSVVAMGSVVLSTGTSNWGCRLVDDSGNQLGGNGGDIGSTLDVPFTINGKITYTSSGNHTIKLQCFTPSSTLNLEGSTLGRDTSFYVTYLPSQSQSAFDVTGTPANWAGTSTLQGTTTATGSPADPGSITGAIVSTTSRNITCSAAASLLGITCTLPRTGNYQVCYGGYMADSSGSTGVNSELTDGSNSVVVGLQWASITSATGQAPMGGCSNYLASSQTVTFKERGYVTSGTATYNPTYFSVTELDAPTALPYNIPNAPIHDSAGIEKIGRATISNNGSSAAVVSQSGDWVSSATRTGLSTVQINFKGSGFSSAPSCITTGSTSGSQYYSRLQGEPTTSSVTVVTTSDSGASVDGNFDIICMGPH